VARVLKGAAPADLGLRTLTCGGGVLRGGGLEAYDDRPILRLTVQVVEVPGEVAGGDFGSRPGSRSPCLTTWLSQVGCSKGKLGSVLHFQDTRPIETDLELMRP
jgi:hypothetical protein